MNLYFIIGLIVLLMGIWGLLTGKVIAGARGLKSNYYTRQDSPALYYMFVIVYLCIGAFIIMQSS